MEKYIVHLIMGVTGVNLLMTATFVLKQHRTWVRLIDQHVAMYKDYCKNHNITYQALNENSTV